MSLPLPAGERAGERAVLLSLLCLTSCASTQVLTPSEASAISTRTWKAPSEEVFDATLLTLRENGHEVTQFDRVAGTLHLDKFDLDVAALGTEQRVVVTPHQQITRAELGVLLDALESGTRTLLGAWLDLPEWKFDGRHNLLRVPGFSVAPPAEWEWLDYDISRRFVVVQQRRARTGLNPTLLVDLDRRRPDSVLASSLRRGAGLALAARSRVTMPDELSATEDETGQHGKLRVLDGTVPLDVAWHASQVVLGSSEVRLIMVCPRATEGLCRDLWRAIFASIQRDP